VCAHRRQSPPGPNGPPLNGPGPLARPAPALAPLDGRSGNRPPRAPRGLAAKTAVSRSSSSSWVSRPLAKCSRSSAAAASRSASLTRIARAPPEDPAPPKNPAPPEDPVPPGNALPPETTVTSEVSTLGSRPGSRPGGSESKIYRVLRDGN